MNDGENIINGECERYVCSECRTKYGYPHQRWCTKKDVTEPSCLQCIYFGKGERCRHPSLKALKKERSAVRNVGYFCKS